jgi:hypothetical protein
VLQYYFHLIRHRQALQHIHNLLELNLKFLLHLHHKVLLDQLQVSMKVELVLVFLVK